MDLLTLVQMRPRTDLVVPVSWLLLPLASYLLWAVLVVSWWAAGAGIGTAGQGALLALNSAEEGFYRLSRGEHERSAVLWALLASVPIVGWIFLFAALWFLSRDFAKHSRLEGPVLEDMDRTMKGAGSQG